MGDYEICHFSIDTVAAYDDFINRYNAPQAKQRSDYDRIQWWIFNNPIGGYYACAYNNTELCSTCYISGKYLRLGDRCILAYEIGDTWTLPHHRRKGLFSRLVKHCTELAIQAGADLVYGTPNSQSTPGYQKLDYQLEWRKESYFNLMPAPMNILLHRSKLLSSSIGDINHKNTVNMEELSLSQYIEKTLHLNRTNHCTKDYLHWRFGSSPIHYRFFSLKILATTLFIAMRKSTLGSLWLLYVVEYFQVGEDKLTSKQFQCALRKISNHHYRGHDGIYVLTHKSTSSSPVFAIAKRGFVNHRQLPICYMLNEKADQTIRNNISSLFESFQLSDCDIG